MLEISHSGWCFSRVIFGFIVLKPEAMQVWGFEAYLEDHHCWFQWLVTPVYMPFRPFGRGRALLRVLANHGYQPLSNWDDPPRRATPLIPGGLNDQFDIGITGYSYPNL